MARKKKHAEHVNHERWLVSYADFITLLFAFFTTLYAISTVDQKKVGKLQYSMMTAFSLDFFPSEIGISGHPPLNHPVLVPPAFAPVVNSKTKGTSKDGERKPLIEQLRELAKHELLKDKITVRPTKAGAGIVVSLKEASFFRSGRAELQKDALPSLAEVVKVIERYKDELHMVIEGHTDNVPVRGGRFGSNWELSTARSTFVVDYLLQNTSFEASQIAAAGYAEHRPIAPNDTAEGRARNRRIDLVIKPGKGE